MANYILETEFATHITKVLIFKRLPQRALDIEYVTSRVTTKIIS